MITKKCAVSLGYFSLTLLLCFTALHILQIFDISKWVGVSVGLATFVVTLVLMIAFHKKPFIKYIVIPVNAIASGVAMSSLFVYLQAYPEIWQTAALFFALCLLYYIYCILSRFEFFQNHYIICILLCTVVLVAVGSVCLGMNYGIIFALALLCVIPFIAALIALVMVAADVPALISNISYTSVAALFIVALVVLVIISEGEALEALDGDFGGGGHSSNRRNPYDFG